MSVTSESLDGPPLLELKGSHFAAGGLAGATTLRVFADRVETDRRVGLRNERRVVRFEDMASTETRSDSRQWDTLVITARDGDQLEVPGLSSEAASGATETIRSAAGTAHTDATPGDATPAAATPGDAEGHALLDDLAEKEPVTVDVGDALRHLNSLRAEGAISEEEFSQRKAELFSSRG